MSWLISGAWNAVSTLGANIMLRAFGEEELEEAQNAVVDPAERVTAALDGQRWDDVALLYLGKTGLILTPDLKRRIEHALLNSDAGQQALAARPQLAGAVLSAADPDALRDVDLSICFGDAKNAVMSEALITTARKQKQPGGMALDRDQQCDVARFSLLAGQISPDVWNDKGIGLAQPRGVGPIVCGLLWQKGQYDQLCEMIDYGVDTSTSAPHRSGLPVKQRGGRVQPVQHVISPLLKQVDALTPVDDPLTAPANSQLEGARKVLAKLKAKGGAETLTSYADVKSSEMLTAFKDKPGTIWGFEEVRQPYVQAAHETDQGKEPLRMLELWEAVGPVKDYHRFEQLLADPDTAVRELVAAGRVAVETGIARAEPKFAEIAGQQDAYIAKFEQFATRFLQEFAQMMPKGADARPKLDDSGTEKNNDSVSSAAGIMPGGLMAGLLCTAGLWWAKEEGAPVYYCLDGVKMSDVTDYKKVKNKTIEGFIASGNDPDAAHNEGITMVELREILKNWDQLKGTIVFVEKGVILKDADLDRKVAQWREDLRLGDEAAGPTPAPPKATFTGELNKIDAGLLGRIPDTPEGGRDARAIVRKFGYLEKIARTKPQIALNYLIAKCDVLERYDIVAAALTRAAADVVMLDPDAPMPVVVDACAALKAQLAHCHADLQRPLEAALLRHPLMMMLEHD